MTANNNILITPGSGTSQNTQGSFDNVASNQELQQAFINMLSALTNGIAFIAQYQNATSVWGLSENDYFWETYMAPVMQHANTGGSNWTPSGTDQLDMTTYQSEVQKYNAEVSEINQGVSTMSSALTNLQSSITGDSNNSNTTTGDAIDTMLASMVLHA
ncbi:MAG TPA: hypothetical protein VHK67_04875 [Rhabdochlamydiaceae bacterium]|jgi:hypothetical protein|nr:hypothetical protein [Rhabdochlamydiaceae bacterium]